MSIIINYGLNAQHCRVTSVWLTFGYLANHNNHTHTRISDVHTPLHTTPANHKADTRISTLHKRTCISPIASHTQTLPHINNSVNPIPLSPEMPYPYKHPLTPLSHPIRRIFTQQLLDDDIQDLSLEFPAPAGKPPNAAVAVTGTLSHPTSQKSFSG